MEQYISQFSIYFITLFFCIDVIGATPIFIAMTCGLTPLQQKKIVNKSILTSLIILTIFALSGLSILNVFGITLAAFKLAGGILLLLLAIEMVLGRKNENETTDQDCSNYSDIAIFPIALPLLSGPAAISVLIVFMKQAEHHFSKQCLIILALLLNMAISWVVLRYANKVKKLLGESGIRALTKIFGILMSAMACQFIINGVLEAFKGV